MARNLLTTLATEPMGRPLQPLLAASGRRLNDWLETVAPGGHASTNGVAEAVRALSEITAESGSVSASFGMDALWDSQSKEVLLPTGLQLSDDDCSDAELFLRRALDVCTRASASVREALSDWAATAEAAQAQPVSGGQGAATAARVAMGPALASAVELVWWWARYAWELGTNVSLDAHALLPVCSNMLHFVAALVTWAATGPPELLGAVLGSAKVASEDDATAEGGEEEAVCAVAPHAWAGTRTVLQVLGTALPQDSFAAHPLLSVQLAMGGVVTGMLSSCLRSVMYSGSAAFVPMGTSNLLVRLCVCVCGVQMFQKPHVWRCVWVLNSRRASSAAACALALLLS